MKDFTLNIKLYRCLYGLLLGILFILPGQTCAASASRSLFSRAITSARNHPIMTAAGLVGTGYLLYKWLNKKRAVRAMPGLPVPRFGGHPDEQVRNRISQEMRAMQEGEIITAQDEKLIIHDVLYGAALALPEEMLSLIMDYHQPVFRGIQVHDFGNAAGHPRAFIALSNNYFASGHDQGVIKFWSAKTKQCVRTVQLGAEGSVNAFCMLDSTRLLVATRSEGEKNLYLVNMDTSAITLVNFHKSISSMVALSAQEVLVGLVDSASLWDINTQTNETHELRLRYQFRISCTEILGCSSHVSKVNGDTFVVGVGSDRNNGFIGALTLSVLRNKIEAKDNVINAEDFKWVSLGKNHQSMTMLYDKKLATGSLDGYVTLWNCDTGELLKTIQISPLLSVRSIIEFPDDSIVVATDYNMEILRRDDSGKITSLEQRVGAAPLMLLPQGLVTSDSNHDVIRLVQ